MELIDKSAVVAKIEARYNECLKRAKIIDAEYWNGKADAYHNILDVLDTLEMKEVEEEYVNDDLEDYAKKESESFAEREYEIDYIDRNALAKGYYWGIKAGAQWQALHSLETIKGMEEQAFLAGVEAEQINKSFSKEGLLNRWRNKL